MVTLIGTYNTFYKYLVTCNNELLIDLYDIFSCYSFFDLFYELFAKSGWKSSFHSIGEPSVLCKTWLSCNVAI